VFCLIRLLRCFTGRFYYSLQHFLLHKYMLLCASGNKSAGQSRYGVRKNAVEVGMKLTQRWPLSARRLGAGDGGLLQ